MLPLTTLLLYFVIFACIAANSLRALIGAILSDKELMFDGLFGVVMEVLILGAYLLVTGQLFDNKK